MRNIFKKTISNKEVERIIFDEVQVCFDNHYINTVEPMEAEMNKAKQYLDYVADTLNEKIYSKTEVDQIITGAIDKYDERVATFNHNLIINFLQILCGKLVLISYTNPITHYDIIGEAWRKTKNDANA